MKLTDVKGTLARLLAAENLVVEHKAVSTASFDVAKRVLILPIWNVKEIVYNLLVGHEVGHALFTPNDDKFDQFPCPKSYVNVTEDARIEKLMKRKFPGLAKDFYGGYRQLHEDDFFSVKEINTGTLKLIDRINLYFKLGANAFMPFTDDEALLRDKTGVTETFQEAIDVAEEIYKFENSEKESKPLTDIPTESPTGSDGGEGDESDTEQDTSEWFTDTPPSEDSTGDADLDTPSYDMGGGEESLTDSALSDAIGDTASTSTKDEVRYVEIPSVDLDHVIIDAHTINSMTEQYWGMEMNSEADWTIADAKWRKFKKECGREVSYLAKEFEMRKSASSYARQSQSKTGVLDTTKLPTYLFNEDLFKKVTVRPDGKNHGLIFLLDWSGSMADIIHPTIQQLMSLCFFCRKVGIPFDVYSFITDSSYANIRDYTRDEPGKEGTFYIAPQFHLLNLLSSSLNSKEFEKYANNLYRVGLIWDQRYGQAYYTPREVPDCLPPHMMLGGTPLNEALMCMQSLIPRFKAKNDVEKCHVSVLSDGEACWSGEWVQLTYQFNPEKDPAIVRSACRANTCVRDRKTGRTYNPPSWGNCLTETLLKSLKGRFPQCNFTGFRIGNTREIYNMLRFYNDMPMSETDKLRLEFAKSKSVAVEMMGFQDLYLIQSKDMQVDTTFDVDDDATKAQIKNAFRKTLKSKASNKKILSSFITQIA
jgi:hypothetical protein